MKKKKDTATLISDIAADLLTHLEIEGDISVQSEDDQYDVHFDVEESGMLIGYHGETLDSLRLILSYLVHKQVGDWVSISVDVGNYYNEREQQLQRIADSLVDKVLSNKKSETMPLLNPRERRMIHMYLSTVKEVKTESVGEDEERRLVIFPA